MYEVEIMVQIFFAALLSFIALLNPVQKIFVIFSLQQSYDKNSLKRIVNRSSLTAYFALMLFLVLGNQILSYVFNIEIYAFQIICGIVLAISGLSALQSGAYIKLDNNPKIESITAVPIAIPMIAGPATITAAVTMPSIYGWIISIVTVSIGIFLNWIIMRNAKFLGNILNKYNILNPLSRIFGLIVAAIGVQLILNGIHDYVMLFI